MHREISHVDSAFHEERQLPLFLLTGFLGLLIALDLVPLVASWLGIPGVASWPREWFGYRIALAAAGLGGARVLDISLVSLSEGTLGADPAIAIACLAALLIQQPLAR